MSRDLASYPPGRQPPPEAQPNRLDIPAQRAEDLRAQDHWRINLDEDWERRFWSREFGVTEAQLQAAVGSAGSLAGAVRAFLSDAGQARKS